MAISVIGSNDLGKILKEVSKGMVYDNLSSASPAWDFVYGKKVAPAEGRELHYSCRTALGVPAVGALAINGATFHKGKKSTLLEATAYAKKFGVTIEVDNSVVEMATKDFACYGQPIAEEVEAKGIAEARDLSRQFYGDGSGVIGTVLTEAQNTPTGYGTIVLSDLTAVRGFVGWVQKGDHLAIYKNDGTARTCTFGGAPGTACYYEVVSVNRSSKTIIVKAYSAATDATATLDDWTVDVGDLIYRYSMTKSVAATPDNATVNIAGISSSTEYSRLSIEYCGLEALASASAITVHGLLHGTDVVGTDKDVGGAIDAQDFQTALTAAEVACGAGRYSYKKAFMANETYDAFVESRETDRMFMALKDSDRGTDPIGYVYKGKRIAFESDEFCPKTRIWLPPEGDVLQWHGGDFEPVKPQGSAEWHLKVSSAGYSDTAQMFMTGLGFLACVHPASVIRIHNFTI